MPGFLPPFHSNTDFFLVNKKFWAGALVNHSICICTRTMQASSEGRVCIHCLLVAVWYAGLPLTLEHTPRELLNPGKALRCLTAANEAASSRWEMLASSALWIWGLEQRNCHAHPKTVTFGKPGTYEFYKHHRDVATHMFHLTTKVTKTFTNGGLQHWPLTRKKTGRSH